jgi:hypothetical protein
MELVSINNFSMSIRETSVSLSVSKQVHFRLVHLRVARLITLFRNPIIHHGLLNHENKGPRHPAQRRLYLPLDKA